MDQPLLSICIPTYNRAAMLRQCLDSIVAQFSNAEIAGQVEVQISDNGSSDGTERVVAEYQAKWPQIGYFRCEQNMGVDKNILNAVSMAKGEYCWFMGDDDAPFEDAFKHLLPVLATGQFAYLLANSWGYNRELAAPALSQPNLHISGDRDYGALAEFVKNIANYRDMVGYFGGFSCQIVRRSVWQNFPEKEKYAGSQALHLFVILSACKGLPARVLAKPLVKTRADNIRWDSFPGLETVQKRQKATRDTLLWILKTYGLPYSRSKVAAVYYGGLLRSWLTNAARKTLFRSQKSRDFVKKVMGK